MSDKRVHKHSQAPSLRPCRQGGESLCGGGSLDWGALVPLAIHPTKVLVIEAMAWIGRPLSASELAQIFDEKLSTPAISYHVVTLAKWGVLTRVRKQQVRGAWKRLYRLADL